MSPWLTFLLSYEAAFLLLGMALLMALIIYRMNIKKRKKAREQKDGE